MNENLYKETQIFEAILKGESILITGCAGTGKSTLIKKIFAVLQEKYYKEEIGITAMTGIASLNIEGKTIHSYLKIGIEKHWKEMVKKVNSKELREGKSRVLGMNDKSYQGVWERCRCLIVDEVSMLGANWFRQLNKTARHFRKNNSFFGGIQLILIGDFFQLPPVTKRNEKKERYLFESSLFKKYIKRIIELDYVFRQRDPDFLKVLDEVRYGYVTDFGDRKLREALRPLDITDGITATILHSLNKDVSEYNNIKIKELKGDLNVFISRDYEYSKNWKYPKNTPMTSFKSNVYNCEITVSQISKMSNNEKWKFYTLNKTKYVDILRLKEGAQVMYLKNTPELGLFNGSRGVVTGFDFESGVLPFVKFKNGVDILVNRSFSETLINKGTKDERLLVRNQLPLRLAWAVTIHKSQGLTLDKVKISMENIFTSGQFYVALSRVRTLDGLELVNYDISKISTDHKVIEFYAGFNQEARRILEKKYKNKYKNNERKNEKKNEKNKKKTGKKRKRSDKNKKKRKRRRRKK